MLSLPLLQEIVNYLETRPFKEVARLLTNVQIEYNAAQQPKPEEKPDAPKIE